MDPCDLNPRLLIKLWHLSFVYAPCDHVAFRLILEYLLVLSFPACETAILHLGSGAPILRRTCPCLAALLCRFHPIHTRPRASLVSCPKSRGSYTYRTELVTRRSCFADASMASIVQSADIPVSFLSVRALDPCMALVTDERSRSRVSCSNLTIMVA